MKKTGLEKKRKQFSRNNLHSITPITIQMSEVRSKVIQLYKQLQYLGREYPGGAQKFRQQCHEAFLKNKDVQDPKQIMALVAKGRYVVKELEALYSLKKYRAMKQRYEKN